MDQVLPYILPYLPTDARALLLDPPSLTSPSSFLPLIRLLWPIGRWLVVILAFYIVWSTVAGIVGYFSRFMRFALKVGPLLGLVGMIMAQTGQGGLGDIFGAVQEWAGLGVGNRGRTGDVPGMESLKGMFGQQSTSKRTTRTKRKTSTENTDPLSNIWQDASRIAQGEDWQGIVQGYVQNAVAKASGLSWLFDGTTAEEKPKKRAGRR